MLVIRELWVLYQQISLRHVNCLSAANIERPYIYHDKKGIIEIFGNQVTKVYHYFGNKSINVSIYLGFDTTMIVRGFQILIYHDKSIYGDSPNHSLDIGDK